jgi:phytoene synthase
MIEKEAHSTFKKGSRTYFYSSLFFPRDVKSDVFTLYAFVRKADNFVDSIPQSGAEFVSFRKGFEDAYGGRPAGDATIDNFAELAHRRGFDKEWVDSFFVSMALDLSKHCYRTLDETLLYIYGSAEVIGLMMSRILSIDHSFDDHSRSLGKAMQYINFIRDIGEDHALGRIYFPMGELSEHGLPDLSRNSAESNPEGFRKFVRIQLQRYSEWQRHAEGGFPSIPRRYLIPISTASDMYNWTAKMIEHDPFIVYRRKVKPSRTRIIISALGKSLGRKGYSVREPSKSSKAVQ